MNLLIPFLVILHATQVSGGQARNPDATQGLQDWEHGDRVTVENIDGNPAFVARQGILIQRVRISEGNEDLYIVLAGRVQSEFVHPEGFITDRPYLYAYVLGESERIIAYLQSETMRARSPVPNQWEAVYGMFKLPHGASRIQFQLSQGSPRGVESTGAAGRFDDLAVYVTTSEEAARAVAAQRIPDTELKMAPVSLPVPSSGR